MRLSCKNCGAKYSIADEKVTTKKVKFRCKCCGVTSIVPCTPTGDLERQEAIRSGEGDAPTHDQEASVLPPAHETHSGIAHHFSVSRLQDGRVVSTQRIEKELLLIGRKPASDVLIDEPAVADMQAVVERVGERDVQLISLWSGTLVNGVEVNKQAISPSDRITIGDTVLQVELNRPDAAPIERRQNSVLFSLSELSELARPPQANSEDERQPHPGGRPVSGKPHLLNQLIEDVQGAAEEERLRQEAEDGARRMGRSVDDLRQRLGLVRHASTSSDEHPSAVPKPAPRANMPDSTEQTMPATARGGEDPGRVDVMISYARADEAQVFPWVQRLRQAGAAVWIDQGGIDGALLWGAEIVSAIERCTVFMLMISPRSIGSRNVWKEVHLADSAAKPILPLILEQTPIPTELAYALAGVQFLELQAHSEDDVMEAILRSLRRLGVGLHKTTP